MTSIGEVRIILSGMDVFEKKLAQLNTEIAGKALADATLAGALVVEAAAKEKAPVRTGNLRRSIHSAIVESTSSSASAMVGTDVEYAPYQEFGTRKMAAHAYLRPALDEKAPEAKAIIAKAFKALIAEATR